MSSSECIRNQFADVFEGDGLIEGEVHLEVDPSAKPHQQVADTQDEQVYAIQQTKQFAEMCMQIQNINLLSEVSLNDDHLTSIRSESEQDPEIRQLMETCQKGWPNEKSAVRTIIQRYWNIRDEITICDGILLRGDRIIIPRNLRAQTIEALHYGHTGIESCLRRARETVYWPNIIDHIKNVIQNCQTCWETSTSQAKLPLQSSPIPELPFQRVNMDLCEVQRQTGNSKEILLIVSDSFSDWIEVEELRSMTASTIVLACKRLFSRQGIPSVVVADSGTQFNSREFLKFARNWAMKVALSSPHHHQGNGKAEPAVKIVKRIFRRADKSGQDRWLALLEWRNTPNHMQTSPAQWLYSRRL
ncbi:uncharacterized protein K02A2.6-like [Rhagoletis pomonella]|uniref:uncharacterized protein K02A2.6-like n=1 Tax=Rhagoletis pomonella TaxID=28610 RepID=UPI00178568CD|nr:uncharacterized protein K02A2.6-like [Rhagoletis pomonella]